MVLTEALSLGKAQGLIAANHNGLSAYGTKEERLIFGDAGCSDTSGARPLPISSLPRKQVPSQGDIRIVLHPSVLDFDFPWMPCVIGVQKGNQR